VAEWSNVPDSKSGVGATLPRVRIPPSPPNQKPRCAGFFLTSRSLLPSMIQRFDMKFLIQTVSIALTAVLLQGCTVLAIADVAASTVVYGVKTVVNVVDAVTPDIVNKKKDK
jgi:hypothetical protein